MAVHKLVFVHGMVSTAKAFTHHDTYTQFYEDLEQRRPGLRERLGAAIEVEWGHLTAPGAPAAGIDQKLSAAEANIGDRVDRDAVRTYPPPGNVILSGLQSDLGLPVRGILEKLRTELMLYGVGDVIYYCSPDGEKQIRAVVYQQILSALPLGDEEVRLHIVAHSLGVTLSHDLLFGLFKLDHTPGFVEDRQADPETLELFGAWRDRAQAGRLKLGSFSAFASQLPLFALRKNLLIDRMAGPPAGRYIEAGDIGVPVGQGVVWNLFYDIDDLLSYPTRPVYRPDEAIREFQVDCGDNVVTVHSNYWRNKTVLRETADLLDRRTS